MAKLSRDFEVLPAASTTLHPRECAVVKGFLAAANAEIVIPSDGASHVALDLRGTYVGTMALEGSVDGTNWTAIPFRQVNGGSILYTIITASAVNGVFMAKAAGYRLVRARMVAFTSGSCLATLSGHTAPYEDAMASLVTPLVGTAVGAAGAAVTLTLAAAPTGLRHYLTYLSINRFATALLTAGAAPVTVTTTNLPGSLAFSFAADAAAQGTIDRWREDFAYPLAGNALATATTIVCPATTGVIWRVTAGYYQAP